MKQKKSEKLKKVSTAPSKFMCIEVPSVEGILQKIDTATKAQKVKGWKCGASGLGCGALFHPEKGPDRRWTPACNSFKIEHEFEEEDFRKY